ncbi:3-oxoacyl-[acyl-carrier-protein] synthase III C-terminal domain-containing protein [Thalassoroseus pseudoceratinae]|uniref:3-oxoacyl-[acyl-carrier-protein] synthase III C-terminal domain-containing protein n=1 Tax=Thalassoroseus pseudoceratinae TaxID=2713176 RepID=UPI00141DE32E|nr:3-oxoacyl-[acyl-carrier-protein] synthase III C-terminal domain-containing protein [Thalassoroseus pseudoceratinae]
MVPEVASHRSVQSDRPNLDSHEPRTTGGSKVITAIGQVLILSPEQLVPSQSILKRYGNMSSPTIAFILSELQRNGASGPCVPLAFGPGLTVEAALLTR